MLYFTFIFYSLFTSCLAEPYTVGWTQDPNGRGTTGLIISCVTTLFLCIWSSMHLNVPPKDEKQLGYWTRSLRWVLLGILIPELVILAAWRQWLSARRLTTRMKEALENQDANSKPTIRRYDWTVEHSYFAGMGGFVFDSQYLPQGGDALFSSDVERLTLTASGALLLAQCGHLPVRYLKVDIDGNSIQDKSKADGLSKAVVCVQVSWMLAQTVGRLAAQMPITLLEVNTLGHVFCAFVIYVLWWRKPKEVKYPIVLKGEWTTPLAAYMYMSSRMSGTKPTGRIVLKKWIKPELSELGLYPHSDSSDEQQDLAHLEDRIGLATDGLANRQPDGDIGVLRRRPSKTLTKLETIITITPALSRDPDHLRVNRLEACSEAVRTYDAVRQRFKPEKQHTWLRPEIAPCVTYAASNWPSDDLLPGLSGKTMGMALWLSSSLYGGIHLAAWLDFFPTEVEAQLWRLSAAFIAASGALWFGFCLVASRWTHASDYWHRFIDLNAWTIEYVFFGTIAGLCGLSYILARVYLVVEAVVSLRRLPYTAYLTPDWSTIFPHI